MDRSSSNSSVRTRQPSADQPGSGSSSPIFELLVVFAVVYVLQGIATLAGVMGGLFVLSPPVEHNPWTIVTSVYAHGGLWHLLSNSLALIVFGWPVARATTRLRFHTFFLLTGSIAGVSQIVLTAFAASVPMLPVTPSLGVLGASGAVFALLGYLVASNRLSAGQRRSSTFHAGLRSSFSSHSPPQLRSRPLHPNGARRTFRRISARVDRGSYSALIRSIEVDHRSTGGLISRSEIISRSQPPVR